MKPISLGTNCYTKDVLKKCGYDKETDIFDWMNTFYFGSLISSLENNFNIFDNIEVCKLPGEPYDNVIFNNLYNFRLPHDSEYWKNRDVVIEKYQRRFNRFLQYRIDNDNYLFIRTIRLDNQYGIEEESILQQYSETNRLRINKFLPSNSIIVLLTDKKIDSKVKEIVNKNYILLDEICHPEKIIYTGNKEEQERMLNLYNDFFCYCDEHFDELILKNTTTVINKILKVNI